MRKIAEIQIKYSTGSSRKPKISDSEDVCGVLREIWDYDTIEYQERFYALYLNRANRVLGYRIISVGGAIGTVVDIKQLIGIALKCNANAIILAHNHPSGNVKPSQTDILLTKKIQNGCNLLEIKLVDHVIMTAERHFSFSDEGLL
jgi:DNA repair protein RadC